MTLLALARPPVFPDTVLFQSALDVRNPDIDWKTALGAAIGRAVRMVGWSHKEAAAAVGVDDAEFGKWISGTRPPQWHRLFACKRLRGALRFCLASLGEEHDDDIEVVTEIRLRHVRTVAGAAR